MSDPSKSSPLSQLHHHHQNHQHLPVPPPSSPSSAPGTPAALVRDYRKGNWTLHETLILIAAKRLDDERRAVGGGGSGGGGASSAHCSPSSVGGGSGPVTLRSAEQRWKWVENHCWSNGCLRSQNQCNDKWDNLLRDYKKVRDYEASATEVAASTGNGGGAGERPSYWAMERLERKERNLPTNLAPEVFEALTDVLSRRAARRGNVTPLSSRPPPPPSSPPKLQQPPAPANPPSAVPLPSPTPPLPTAPPVQPSVPEVSVSSESEENEGAAGPEPKRRRLGSSVVRSATVLSRTLLACEEKRDQRHRELVELEERRLRLEEEQTEMRRQGFASIMSAVNNLSGAIHALVAGHRNGDAR